MTNVFHKTLTSNVDVMDDNDPRADEFSGQADRAAIETLAKTPAWLLISIEESGFRGPVLGMTTKVQGKLNIPDHEIKPFLDSALSGIKETIDNMDEQLAAHRKPKVEKLPEEKLN